MEWVVIFGSSIIVYAGLNWFLTKYRFFEDPKPVVKPEPQIVYVPVQAPAPRLSGKIVEATEHSTEYPNGMIVSERKIRQWN